MSNGIIEVEDHELAILEGVSIPKLFEPKGGDTLLKVIEKNTREMIKGATAETHEDREIIRSTAYKIAQMKKRIDAVKTNYVRDIKALPMQIDAEGRRIRERLEALHDEIRGPLTDWENADKARKEAHQAKIAELSIEAIDTTSMDSDDVHLEIERIDDLYAHFDFEEFQSLANKTRSSTINSLKDIKAVKIGEEFAEEKRLAAEQKAREEREAQLIKETEERTRREEQEKHDEEIRQIQYAEERKRVEAVQAERERIAKEQAEEEEPKSWTGSDTEPSDPMTAEDHRDMSAALASRKDTHHDDPFPASPTAVIQIPVSAIPDKKTINREILAGFTEHFTFHLPGTTAEVTNCARQAALAVINGKIPHVTISYPAE